MRQLTRSDGIADEEDISKLPMRQLTKQATQNTVSCVSKLPMRQLTRSFIAGMSMQCF